MDIFTQDGVIIWSWLVRSSSRSNGERENYLGCWAASFETSTGQRKQQRHGPEGFIRRPCSYKDAKKEVGERGL